MLIIATCKAYKEGNEALKKLKAKLENLHYQCELKAWQEIRVRHLAQNTLILPLAVWDYSLEYANFLHFLNELERAKISIL
ncbi:TPA: hypothetical protein RY080_001427, partial [Campylobacter upsaliensis]|nr:hypothetical protein [Campylobacter upsaliensis]